ncbi:MAG: HDOD domain-containing protein, partial [Acidobacteriota bacterium]|nr:HDOD domain-containing protein [Acidobacteriota bacterium]
MTTTDPCVTDSQALAEILEEAIDDGHLTLPLMPDVAARVKVEAANPHSSAHKLAGIITTDAALAARVLRMANSAIYAGMSEIRELDLAIGRLGAAMVVALAVGAAGR